MARVFYYRVGIVPRALPNFLPIIFVILLEYYYKWRWFLLLVEVCRSLKLVDWRVNSLNRDRVMWRNKEK